MPSKQSNRRVSATILMALAILVALAVPVAFGGPGDSPEEAIRLPVPTSTVAAITAGHTWVMYSVWANAGTTVRVDAAAAGPDCGMLLGTLGDPYVLEGKHTSASSVGLTFMAPRPGYYLLVFNAETYGPYSITATPTVARRYTVGSMWAPGSVKHGKKFTVAARTFPAYNSVTSPIRFMIERWSGKKYKAYGSVPGKFSAQFLSGNSSKITSASFKLSKRGMYRVRGRLTDAAHRTPVYSAWKKVNIK